ncbi:SGNH/GDSL hydrolase family protein [Dyadobacter pollutisoli]|uniref:SGNH/GDSL hydrolase family protein n=1 Tax=Dyadobacter pollutisoli TaxID=2910158 RepID=A0A9E8N8R3_9BACT|nr:SGNH/GDSL hydrolase family protein [Dyadobacter pollutisoli]WAC11408.1 SGNH/GDSL hydrolase family protein [Dyadobacter pollutisoli]
MDDHPHRPGSQSRNNFSRRRFFLHSGAAILTTTLLTSCSDLLDNVLSKNDKESEPMAEEPKRDQTLAFFGDSLTIGAGGTFPYGTLVGAMLPGRPIVSDGIGGQIALSIACRQGGTPIKLSVEGDKLNGAKAVKITKLSNEFLSTPINYNTYSRAGTIAGVKCTVTRMANEEKGEMYTLTPDSESTAAIPAGSEFVIEDSLRLKSATQILWYGRNNMDHVTAEDEIISALDSSIAYITDPKRYIVLGILLAVPEVKGTDRYNKVIAINEKLSSKYGRAFVPMTPPTAAEMAAINYTPTSQDLADLENMNFPTGLRPDNKADYIHINDKGYQIIANRVVAKLKELKY